LGGISLDPRKMLVGRLACEAFTGPAAVTVIGVPVKRPTAGSWPVKPDATGLLLALVSPR